MAKISITVWIGDLVMTDASMALSVNASDHAAITVGGCANVQSSHLSTSSVFS